MFVTIGICLHHSPQVCDSFIKITSELSEKSVCYSLLAPRVATYASRDFGRHRGAGAGHAGTAAVGPMLEAKLMNLIKGRLQKF